MSQDGFPYAQSRATFMGCDPLAQHPFAVVGIPFDGAVTNRTGARMGPNAIRQASWMLCDAEHPVFDVSPVGYCGDAGNMSLPNASGLDAARREIESQALALMERHHVIALGGDHSVTLALLRAAFARHGRMALVHFDAHCDTWTDHFGEPSGHGTWVAEAIAEGLVEPTQCVQIGIRSSGIKAARNYVKDQGGDIYTARQLRGKDGEALQGVVDEIVDRLGDTPAYLTVDIDCLDPAFAPGTGTPEPGGLTSSQLLTFIEEMAPLHWIGMDCVEVSPPYDHAELTSQIAAQVVWTYVAGQVAQITQDTP